MLSVLDVFLVLGVLCLFAWGIYKQTVGMLLTWICFWIAVVLAGSVVLTLSGAYGLGMKIQRALWGGIPSLQLVQAVIFLVLGSGISFGLHLLVHYVFPNPGIPKLGIVDNVLGGVLGLGLAAVAMALLSNLWRIMVSVSWQPYWLWRAMWTAYEVSTLKFYLRPVLLFSNKLFFPFALMGYPIVLLP